MAGRFGRRSVALLAAVAVGACSPAVAVHNGSAAPVRIVGAGSSSAELFTAEPGQRVVAHVGEGAFRAAVVPAADWQAFATATRAALIGQLKRPDTMTAGQTAAAAEALDKIGTELAALATAAGTALRRHRQGQRGRSRRDRRGIRRGHAPLHLRPRPTSRDGPTMAGMDWYWKAALAVSLIWAAARALGIYGEAARDLDLSFLFAYLLTLGGWGAVFLIVDRVAKFLGWKRERPLPVDVEIPDQVPFPTAAPDRSATAKTPRTTRQTRR